MGPLRGPGGLWASGWLVSQWESVFSPPPPLRAVWCPHTARHPGQATLRGMPQPFGLSGGSLAPWQLYRPGSTLAWQGDAGGSETRSRLSGAVGAQHTARWRRERGLQNDADFAFAFHSFEAALTTGGRDLANSWVRVRSAQESELLMWWRARAGGRLFIFPFGLWPLGLRGLRRYAFEQFKTNRRRSRCRSNGSARHCRTWER